MKTLSKVLAAFVLALAMLVSPVAAANSPVSGTVTYVNAYQVRKNKKGKSYKYRFKNPIKVSKTVSAKKTVANKVNNKKYTIATALKGEKVSGSLKGLKKLTKAQKIYSKRTHRSAYVTLKISKLTSKTKKVYLVYYNAKTKKWVVVKGKNVNTKKKTAKFLVKYVDKTKTTAFVAYK